MRLIAVALLLVLALPAFGESKIICTVQTEEPKELIGSLVGGWTATGGWLAPRYYRDVNGVVHLSGLLMKYGNLAGGPELVFTLPDGYRPRQFEMHSQGDVTLAIDPNGEARVHGTFQFFGSVAMSGITFRAQ